MPTQLLLYRDAKPVSAEHHKDLAVKTGDNYGFAKEVNSVPLTAIEFAQASGEYPIVFAGNDETVMPAVILGVSQNQNLYVDDDGTWQGKYIPAFVRRYPFVFSTDNEGKRFVLHVDENFDGCNRKGTGERLFDSGGEQTQYLKSVLSFLQDYQARFQRTKEYCDRLKSLGLLQTMEAQFNLTSGEQRSLSGFMTGDREKLKAIAAEDLAVMFGNDELECTYLHLHSLRHFGDMLERMPASEVSADEVIDADNTSASTAGKKGHNGKAKPNGADVEKKAEK